jgi:hypothetical protein
MSTDQEPFDPRVASSCLHCGQFCRRKPKRTFLGFRKTSCQDCGRESLYPLSTNYVRVYWIALAVITIVCIRIALNGDIPIPGVLFFAGIYSLWQDRKLCNLLINNPPPSPKFPESNDDPH